MLKKKPLTEQMELGEAENGKPWETHGLFSDYYLRKKLPLTIYWPKDRFSEAAYLECRNLFDRNKERLERFANEDQARHTLIEPILKLLGFFIIPESPLPGKKKTTPDYLLFANESSREAALDAPLNQRYSSAVTLAEAKRYGHNLGEVSKEETQGKFPHQQVNDYLREAVDTSLRKPYFNWAILTNGRDWRLYYRYANSYSYFAFNLEHGVNSREFFKYFWTLFNANAFTKDENEVCLLDRILEESGQHSTALENDLRGRVYRLLERLANGFYERPKNNITPNDLEMLYDNCLIYLYRLLFILYSEGRDLLPVNPYRAGSNQTYREDYSLRRLQERVKKTKEKSEASFRLYNEIDELFTLIDGNEEKMNLTLGVPRYNGGLFDPVKYPKLQQWKVDGRTMTEVLKGLMYSFLHTRKGETEEVSFDEPIDYSELDVRQLGSIYEDLLEHHLVLKDDGTLKRVKRGDPDDSTEKSAVSSRKQTGSYYTPDYIVKYILEQTIRPILNKVENDPEVKLAIESGLKNNSFAERALGLKILDPSMGSGHFLVRATEMLAEEIASHPTTKLAIVSAPFNTSHEFAEIAYWRRRVVESCIYGVDINPLAVELAKLSLWLTCISSTEPLSFIDHHIQCGNALVGSRIRDLDHLKRAGEETEALLTVNGLNEARDEAVGRLAYIRNQGSNRLESVKEKQSVWEGEVKRRIAPFNALADLRSAFDMGLTLENKEYAQIADELLVDSIQSPAGAAELRDKYRFFHWELAFPEVFPANSEDTGFDVVLGNPPYVRSGTISDLKSYLAGYYATYDGSADLYTYFIERGISLLKTEGRFGFIVSNKWMRAEYGESLRKFVLNFGLEILADFGELRVFESSATFPLVMILRKKRTDKPPLYASLKTLIKDHDQLEREINLIGYPLEEGSLRPTGFTLVRVDSQKILDKMSNKGKPFGQYVDNKIYYGIKTGLNEAFIIDKRKRAELIKADPASADIIVPFVVGDDVRKYHINFRERYLILTKNGIDINDYPIIYQHLEKSQKALESRWDQGGHWWELRACDYYDEFLKPKLVWPVIAKESRFARDDTARYYNDKVFFSPVDDNYLLGVLNSTSVWFLLRSKCSILGDPDRGGRLELRAIHVKQTPIPEPSAATCESIGNLVKQASDLHRRLTEAITVRQKSDLKREIEKIESEIDQLVYQLYGLTEKEIAIIEGRS